MHNLFDDLPRTPSMHFKLLFYAAVLRLLRHVVLSYPDLHPENVSPDVLPFSPLRNLFQHK